MIHRLKHTIKHSHEIKILLKVQDLRRRRIINCINNKEKL